MTTPGPLGEEAWLLVDAARDWAARTFPELDQHLATGSAECRWCPVCRGVTALRDPEVADKVANAVTAAAGALAAFLDQLTPPPTPDHGEGPATPGDGDRAEPRSARATPGPPYHHDIPLD